MAEPVGAANKCGGAAVHRRWNADSCQLLGPCPKWCAFAEGMAVLAAAGGPDVNPHGTSPPEALAIWERDVGEFATDLRRIERFFRGVLAGARIAPSKRRVE